MDKIPITENGLEACRKAENKLHPTVPGYPTPFVWWDKRSHTFQLLVGTANQLIDADTAQEAEIAALAARVAVLESVPASPFPGAVG